MQGYILQRFADAQRVIDAMMVDDILIAAIERAAAVCTRSLKAGGKIMLIGNGGSAADAQHIAAELVGRFEATGRWPLSAIALTTDTSVLTSLANDFDYKQVFGRQIAAIGRSGDVLIAYSTSGKSENVIEALKVASQCQIKTIGMTGFSGDHLRELCDITLTVPSNNTARIQEAHAILGHTLCGLIERNYTQEGAVPGP